MLASDHIQLEEYRDLPDHLVNLERRVTREIYHCMILRSTLRLCKDHLVTKEIWDLKDHEEREGSGEEVVEPPELAVQVYQDKRASKVYWAQWVSRARKVHRDAKVFLVIQVA
jgi:hypothetical protein